MEVFQVTLRKGYCSADLKGDLANLYQKTGLKNLGTVFLMTDAQVSLFFIFNFDYTYHNSTF